MLDEISEKLIILLLIILFQSDPITVGLRTLLALSKKLRAKRHANGALTLASSEIRFSIDSETKDPISVQEKRMLATNSMVRVVVICPVSLLNYSTYLLIWPSIIFAYL